MRPGPGFGLRLPEAGSTGFVARPHPQLCHCLSMPLARGRFPVKLGLQGHLLDLPFPKSRVNLRFIILSSFTNKGGPKVYTI